MNLDYGRIIFPKDPAIISAPIPFCRIGIIGRNGNKHNGRDGGKSN